MYKIKFGLRYGYQVIETLNKISKSQWLSHDELLEYQTAKLRRLIKHVYSSVRYYSAAMRNIGLRPEDIKGVEDLKYFPVLTKKDIKNNYDKLTSNDSHKRKISKASTGGTTGESLTVFRDMDTLTWTEAVLLRGMSWAGFSTGDKIVDFCSEGRPNLLGKVRTRLVNRYCFPAYAKENELIRHFEKIKSVRPFALTGYASNLYRIAAVCHKQKINDVKIPVIFSTAEMLYDHQRDFIEQTFNGRVFDYYGCNEIGSLAYQCEYGNKHISDEHVIVEATNAGGVPVMNVPGEITITDLDNYAMPLIRYKNGDVGVTATGACECGRGLSTIKSLQGRAQDFLRAEDGNYVPSIFFANRFRSIKGISQYQIIQNDARNITMKIVRNDSFSGAELTGMTDIIKGAIGQSVNIRVEECDSINITGRGKTRLVISHVPVEF
ncbi:MAG: phenylacetate--CoA ligase family protein [Nitrospirae bacterium]|nr:phenylacetate--CoA ligase family protein [Nitrospirota bacterium]